METRVLRTLLVLLLAQCGLVGMIEAEENDVYLVKDGKAQGHLFLPATAGRPLLLAVQELRDYMHKMTGAELPLAYRGPDTRHRRDIGIQLLVRTRSEWEGTESSQAFTITGTVNPTPEFPLTGVTIAGNTEMAVLYGVYQYLQELGVRWFSPGELGENVPRAKDVAIREGHDACSPSFVM